MTWEDIAARLAFPIHELLSSTSRIGYFYQLTALVFAVGVWVHLRYVSKRTNRSMVQYLFPSSVWLHRSAIVDYMYFVTNRLLWVFVYGWFLFSSEIFAEGGRRTLAWLLGPGWGGVTPHWGWALVMTLGVVLAKDFMMWFAHTMFHAVPFLWEFHKVHHSAEVLNPFTSARMHPVDEIITASLVGIGTGTMFAVLQFALGPAATEIKLLQLNVITTLFQLAAFNLRHSQVWLAYPYWLQFILISPAQHQIHHSSAARHWDKNMGYIFALWDWMFGTLYNPRGYEKLEFGLDTDETAEFQSLGALYLRPFANVLRMARRVVMGRATRTSP